jgi:hypothetical protein
VRVQDLSSRAREYREMSLWDLGAGVVMIIGERSGFWDHEI